MISEFIYSKIYAHDSLLSRLTTQTNSNVFSVFCYKCFHTCFILGRISSLDKVYCFSVQILPTQYIILILYTGQPIYCCIYFTLATGISFMVESIETYKTLQILRIYNALHLSSKYNIFMYVVVIISKGNSGTAHVSEQPTECEQNSSNSQFFIKVKIYRNILKSAENIHF